jgi:hypothetical protein
MGEHCQDGFSSAGCPQGLKSAVPFKSDYLKCFFVFVSCCFLLFFLFNWIKPLGDQFLGLFFFLSSIGECFLWEGTKG